LNPFSKGLQARLRRRVPAGRPGHRCRGRGQGPGPEPGPAQGGLEVLGWAAEAGVLEHDRGDHVLESALGVAGHHEAQHAELKGHVRKLVLEVERDRFKPLRPRKSNFKFRYLWQRRARSCQIESPHRRGLAYLGVGRASSASARRHGIRLSPMVIVPKSRSVA
jgi:hypothetical protein